MKIKIQQTTGEPLPNGSNTAPINNILHSAFSEVRTSINGITLSANSGMFYICKNVYYMYVIVTFSDFYGFRSYIMATMNNGASAKTAPMNQQGYYDDVNPEMKNASFGFIERKSLFAKNNVFHNNPVWFCGPLYTELSTCDQGITYYIIISSPYHPMSLFQVFLLDARLLLRCIKPGMNFSFKVLTSKTTLKFPTTNSEL